MAVPVGFEFSSYPKPLLGKYEKFALCQMLLLRLEDSD